MSRVSVGTWYLVSEKKFEDDNVRNCGIGEEGKVDRNDCLVES